MLWVRSEVFDHGIINISIRWTAPKVLDFLSSLRSAVASKNVLRSKWVEATASRCKPLLAESEAMAYWHIFSVLRQAVTGQHGDWLDIRFIGVVLLCQVFNPSRMRTDHFAKTNESWPSQYNERASASPRHSPRVSSPRGSSPRHPASAQSNVGRGRDTAALISFVMTHFGHFLRIACLSLSSDPTNITAEEFDLLAPVLCGGNSLSQALARLSEANPQFAGQKSIPTKELRKWLERNLQWNDELYPPIEKEAPLVDGPKSPALHIAGLSRTTWFPPAGVGEEVVNIHITSCTDCVIYVTCRTNFVVIAGCHECTIVFVAVSSLCTIQNCEKISVHAVSNCFKMENCTDSSAYIYCCVPPILTGDTRGIKLAPFNVLYSQLNAALQGAGMRFEPDFVDVWAHPVCCTLGSPDETLSSRGGLDDPTTSTYNFVHPKSFQPVVLPEGGRVTYQKPSLCLPQVYSDAFKFRVEEMKAFQKQLAEIQDEGKRRRAQQAIQGHFKEWLQATGKARHLADLVRLAQLGQVPRPPSTS